MSDSEQAAVELWQVQLPNGEVHPATLDQLDAAFEKGMVDANTMVFGPGASAWARLGDLAGIEEEPQAPAAPPVGTETVAGPQTLRPLVSELDLDLDLPPFRPRASKTRAISIAIAAVVAIGGAAFFVTGRGAPTSAAATGNVAAEAQAATPPTPEPPKPATTAETPKAPADPSSSAAASRSSLSDGQRKALADADKALLSKVKVRASPSRSASSPRKSASDPFHKGGDPHDPLNSAL